MKIASKFCKYLWLIHKNYTLHNYWASVSSIITIPTTFLSEYDWTIVTLIPEITLALVKSQSLVRLSGSGPYWAPLSPWEVGSEETAVALGRYRVQEAAVCHVPYGAEGERVIMWLIWKDGAVGIKINFGF